MTAVVVGAGFSGVTAARELIRAGWEVVLIDPGAQPGRGLAYSTTVPWHLLNSPVAAMSVDPGDPAHFERWCVARDSKIKDSDFVPRTWYGEYLSEALRAADELAPGALTIHRGRVCRIFEASSGALAVLLADDVVIMAEKVILAVGNPPPAQNFPVSQAAAAHPGYVADPWQPAALSDLPEGPVLLIGTGLTAVDVALSLTNSPAGVSGAEKPSITAISRHGLLPLAHAPHPKIPLAMPSSPTLAGMLREVRALTGRLDWRSVVDGLRPHWDGLWQRLSTAGQQRFLRHVARYWEVHRHRMAPSIAGAVDALRADGTLSVRRAEVCGLTVADDGRLRAVFRADSGIETGEFAAIVNCTGPGQLAKERLIRTLIADGLAAPGTHGMGLNVDENGALIGRSARPGKIYTLGLPRRGVLWETTAAPEIRAQAAALALHLAPPAGAKKRAGLTESPRGRAHLSPK
jgi:uncharacterized NAD(P)/FAD-binding protein YdhS